MPPTVANDSRIAKNTLFLYARMLLMMFVGLYASRVTLDVLGASDYGIYNIVGGVVMMANFLNSAMLAASQRFITYELGKGDVGRLRTVVCTAVGIHILIAVLMLILAETLGLWFLNTHLNIPEGRMMAANVAYQCSIFTLLAVVVCVPFGACIVAHEHMGVYAYMSVVDALGKLGLVFVLRILTADKLMVYACLILLWTLCMQGAYRLYCRRRFAECTFRWQLDRTLFRQMFAFAGWSIVGNLGFSVKDQGSNIILNIFCGTVLNAARGIANQVSAVVTNFSTNFLMALVPQVTKLYASGNVGESMRLVYAGSRYSFLLLLVIVVPFVVNSDYLLALWLVEVPAHTVAFVNFCLVCSLLHSMTTTLTTAMQATGRIRNFQLAICLIMLCEPPLAWVCLRLGFAPWTIMLPAVLVTFVGLVARMVLVKQVIPQFSMRRFAVSIVLRNIVIGLVCALPWVALRPAMGDGLAGFLLSSGLALGVTLVVVTLCGLTAGERAFLMSKLRR